jgi:50S ribosomal protein L16 3-hydroxylase
LSIPPLLERLFQPVSAAAFIERYFHQLPVAVPQAAAGLCSLATLDTLRGIAAHAEAKIRRSRQGQWWPDEARPSYEELCRSLDEGWTIFVRHAEKYDDGLAGLAREFQQAFPAPIDVHFFCTPPGTPGFGWHYDVEDVFVLQTQGSKKYRLRKNTVNPWPLVETTPDDLSYEAERSLAMECVLAAGDWLYIPPGYWHATQADELSLSLSVGIMSPTAIDLFNLLRPLLVESLRWRQRLPLTGDLTGIAIGEERQRLRAILSDLGDDLAHRLTSEGFLDAYLQWRSDYGEGSDGGAKPEYNGDRGADHGGDQIPPR